MEFDRDGEFERLMEEVLPLSIPNSFVKELVVTLSNGKKVTLSGEELLMPLPMSGGVTWNKLAEQFEKISDVEVLIDIPAIQESVVRNVKNLLAAHFEDQFKKK